MSHKEPNSWLFTVGEKNYAKLNILFVLYLFFFFSVERKAYRHPHTIDCSHSVTQSNPVMKQPTQVQETNTYCFSDLCMQFLEGLKLCLTKFNSNTSPFHMESHGRVEDERDLQRSSAPTPCLSGAKYSILTV